MNIAWISLGALFVAVVLSMVSKVNVGVVSLALAWIVGVYMGGMRYADVIGAFPVPLFITLAGVTLLFGMANVNGTLHRLAARAVAVCRGNAGIIPVMFFVVALLLSSIGPGNIATAALLAPMGMAVGAQAGVPPFLTALMLGNGAQAGALSPFAPDRRHRQRRDGHDRPGGHEWTTYSNNLMAHVVVTFVAYLLFGGWKLFTNHRAADGASLAPHEPFEAKHWLTLGVLATVVGGVILFDFQVGMAALDRCHDPLARRGRRREGSHQADAVGRRADGLRRHGAHRRAREDAGHVALHRHPGERVDAGARSRAWSPSPPVSSRSTAAPQASCCRPSCRPCRGSSNGSAAAIRWRSPRRWSSAATSSTSRRSRRSARCASPRCPSGNADETRTLFNQLLVVGHVDDGRRHHRLLAAVLAPRGGCSGGRRRPRRQLNAGTRRAANAATPSRNSALP